MTYTREQILNMPVGRELDRLVALNVMGFEPSKTEPKLVLKGVRANVVEPYSTYIVSAWEVVRVLSKSYGVNVYEDEGAPCECTLVRYPETVEVAEGETAPEAICKASLLAVMGL